MKPLVIGLAGLLLGILATRLFIDRESANSRRGERASTDSSSTARETAAPHWTRSLAELHQALAQVDSRLAGVEAKLDRLPESRARTPVAPAGLEGDQIALGLRAELRALQASFEARLDELVALHAVDRTLAELKQEKPEIDWGALSQFLSVWDTDKELATRDLVLLTKPEVLQLYGPPTTIWGTDDRLTWLYGQNMDPVTDKYQLEISLIFRREHLAQVYVVRN